MEKRMGAKFILPLNLQLFAEDLDDKVEEQNEEVKDKNTTEGEPENNAESKTFTQEDIDRIVKERLDREKAKREKAVQKEREEAERKRLEEEGKYKEIAESLQAKLDAIQGDALKAKKEALLVKAGYTEDQVAKYLKYVDGSTDEELAQAVEALRADVPPKPRFADPGVGNGAKQEPKKTDLQEKGKTMYQRLKEKGKIRR